jgi:hypothetical protein
MYGTANVVYRSNMTINRSHMFLFLRGNDAATGGKRQKCVRTLVSSSVASTAASAPRVWADDLMLMGGRKPVVRVKGKPCICLEVDFLRLVVVHDGVDESKKASKVDCEFILLL